MQEQPNIRLHRDIALVRIDDLQPAHRNPRTHPRGQVKQIADSIRRFGFTNPVLVDGDKRILAGHGRVAAARLLGMVEVPTLCVAETRGIIASKRGLALAAAAPIEAPDLIGWLVIAQPLDRAELDRLVELAPIALEARVVEASRQGDWLQAAKTGAVFERQESERMLYHVSDLAVLQEGIVPGWCCAIR